MINDRIDIGIKFTDELGRFFDGTLLKLFNEVLQEDDLELFDSNEPLLTFDGQDIIVSDQKMKSKIAEIILENRITDRLFEIEYEKSANKRDIVGYY